MKIVQGIMLRLQINTQNVSDTLRHIMKKYLNRILSYLYSTNHNEIHRCHLGIIGKLGMLGILG